MTDKDLCRMAVKAMEKSYSPYSGCKVGAALLCKDGTLFCGCNIENASYSATVCAERTAIFKAVSEGASDFVKIAVAGGKDGVIDGSFTPCGICRQVMSEFCPGEFVVLTATGGDTFKRSTLSELLPDAFIL